MLEISNTNEMEQLLRTKGESTLRFPAKVNVLLDDVGLSPDTKQELDETARSLRRSLHRCKRTKFSPKTSRPVFS